MQSNENRVVYWHRDLPPASADLMDEHSIETTSKRVPGTLSHRDELWNECYADLLEQTERRLEQEVERMGGDYAHVLDEHVESRHNDVSEEAWLMGRFRYMLYRCAPAPPREEGGS